MDFLFLKIKKSCIKCWIFFYIYINIKINLEKLE